MRIGRMVPLAAIAAGVPLLITAHDAPLNVKQNFISYRMAQTSWLMWLSGKPGI